MPQRESVDKTANLRAIPAHRNALYTSALDRSQPIHIPWQSDASNPSAYVIHKQLHVSAHILAKGQATALVEQIM